MTALETRTVALTAEQWKYLGMAVVDQAQSAQVSVLKCEEAREHKAASMFQEDVAFWNAILTAIRNAAP